MEVELDPNFSKKIQKLKNNKLRNIIYKKIFLLEENPLLGKPLRHELRNHRSLRIGKYRIVYRFDEDKEILYILTFDHREEVYE